MKEKIIWTDADFAEMGFHDSRLYAISMPGGEDCRFILDIDYIFQWDWEKDKFSKQWVAPCQLIFDYPYNVTINLSFENNVGVDIVDIERTKVKSTTSSNKWNYKIETDRGDITLDAWGYKLILARQPSDSHDMNIGLHYKERAFVPLDKTRNPLLPMPPNRVSVFPDNRRSDP